MAYTLGNKCAKNLGKRTVLHQLIIKNVVVCFFGTHCRTWGAWHIHTCEHFGSYRYGMCSVAIETVLFTSFCIVFMAWNCGNIIQLVYRLRSSYIRCMKTFLATRKVTVWRYAFELRLPSFDAFCIIVSASCLGKRSSATMALLLNCSSFKMNFSICFYS